MAHSAMGSQGGGLDGLAARHPILTEEPETPAQREGLIAELKNRGNAAYKAKSMREAQVLYERAIELDDSAAALHGNLSMVLLALGEPEKALASAETAIAKDAQWAKGYYRKATALDALDRYDDAAWAMEEAIRRTDGEAGCKAKRPMEKQVVELQKKAQEAKSAAPKEETVDADRFKKGGEGGGFGAGAAGSAVDALNNAPVPAPKKPKPAAPAPAPAAKPAAKPSAATAADNDGDGVDSDEKIRGYKIRADGSKTSFFHMEISEEAKRIQAEQGAGAGPKKIDAAEAAAHTFQGATEGSSVWNTSGTFEEKDMLKWAEERLSALLVGDGAFSKVYEVEGDALYTFRKGKKGRIFDLNFVADYTAADGAKGKLTVTNFANDGGSSDGDEYELSWSPSPAADVKAALKKKVEAALAQWVADFCA